MVTTDGQWAEFRFFRPTAHRVHLVGDFNSWRNGELPMTRTESGYWLARVKLPAGSFRFRYYADGQWFADYAAFGIEYGPFGVDSVVRVESAEAAAVPAARPRPRTVRVNTPGREPFTLRIHRYMGTAQAALASPRTVA